MSMTEIHSHKNSSQRQSLMMCTEYYHDIEMVCRDNVLKTSANKPEPVILGRADINESNKHYLPFCLASRHSFHVLQLRRTPCT